MTSQEFLSIDLPAILISMLSATVCAVLGNFLILRRQALIGDAISHVTLPGIVIGFLYSGSLSAMPILVGALGTVIISVGLIEIIQRAGRLDSGVAMGVVFTTMFAFGVVLLEQMDASNVHIDAEHALFGNLESTIWLGNESLRDFTTIDTYREMPRQLGNLLVVTLTVGLLIIVFFKELKIATFDPIGAYSIGLPARTMSISLIIIVSVAAVAAFEAVGSILVIAMFICPAATARLLTNTLSRQLWISVLIAIIASTGGYLLAAFGPQIWGGSYSLSAAGMIAVIAGVFQAAVMTTLPRYGPGRHQIKNQY